MKIHVLGSSSIALSVAATLVMNKSFSEVVTVDSADDINPDDGDILICDDVIEVYCGHPLDNIGVNVVSETVDIPKIDNSFRGGSRGKGGKIKYARK